MVYLLIILIVALAIAPLLHFLPSKNQRKVARLREMAALNGLFVEFRELPGRLGPSGGSERVSQHVIYYGKRLPNSLANKVASAAWVLNVDGWRSVASRVPAPTRLEGLGVDILALSIDGLSCGIYWTESEGEEAIGDIKQFLEGWIADLSS
jgi:hypothetical protein